MSIYLTLSERKKFIIETLTPLIKDRKAIVFGDFNIALTANDREGHFSLTPDIIQLRDFLNQGNLIDAADHPQFTYKSAYGLGSRIDYYFIEESLSSNIRLETVVLPLPFDHCALKLHWVPPCHRSVPMDYEF